MYKALNKVRRTKLVLWRLDRQDQAGRIACGYRDTDHLLFDSPSLNLACPYVGYGQTHDIDFSKPPRERLGVYTAPACARSAVVVVFFCGRR